MARCHFAGRARWYSRLYRRRPHRRELNGPLANLDGRRPPWLLPTRRTKARRAVEAALCSTEAAAHGTEAAVVRDKWPRVTEGEQRGGREMGAVSGDRAAATPSSPYSQPLQLVRLKQSPTSCADRRCNWLFRASASPGGKARRRFWSVAHRLAAGDAGGPLRQHRRRDALHDNVWNVSERRRTHAAAVRAAQRVCSAAARYSYSAREL
jgi:hypothetical protein